MADFDDLAAACEPRAKLTGAIDELTVGEGLQVERAPELPAAVERATA